MKLAPQLISRALRVGRFEFPIEQADATVQASANFELNRAALDRVWPRANLALPESLPELEWLYARDGSLSARHVDGQWYANVSIPRLAAERMLGKLQVAGTTAALLAPTHAEQVRAALARMTPRQALIAVIPTERTAGVIMACADFSEAIAGQRLFLACGPDWQEELAAILDAHEGLAPASMMIRVPGLNDAIVESVQKRCEAAFARQTQRHRQRLASIAAGPRRPQVPARKLLVVGDAFNLWDDASSTLAGHARGSRDCVVIDVSLPTQASALCLARAAEPCDAVVAANVGRADHSSFVVGTAVPWVTWLTAGRPPAFVQDAPGDALIVADAAMVGDALAAGWPRRSISIAGEPTHGRNNATGSRVSIVCDVGPTPLPPLVEEMSSYRLVWEEASRAIRADPLGFAGTPEEFIEACAKRVVGSADGLPIPLFTAGIFGSLYAIAFAEGLIARGADVQIFGDGWGEHANVGKAWRGSVRSENTLAAALAETAALVDVWPTQATHSPRRRGRAVIKAWARGWTDVLADVAAATGDTASTSAVTQAVISVDAIRAAIAAARPSDALAA